MSTVFCFATPVTCVDDVAVSGGRRLDAVVNSASSETRERALIAADRAVSGSARVTRTDRQAGRPWPP